MLIDNTSIKYSVVVCVKNEEKRIKKSLQGIIKNNPDEIIVIDGNSNDETKNIAKEFTDNIFNSDAESLTKDRQLGIDKCKNELIAMIDADHILEKDDIVNLINDMEEMNFDIIQSQLKPLSNKHFLNRGEGDYWETIHNKPGKRKMIGTAPAIYKKKVFNDIKFDNHITSKMDDTDFCYRLEKLNKFNIGIGKTKIAQDHYPSIESYKNKFMWYGYGDAQFAKKFPKKLLNIFYHIAFRYPFSHSLSCLFRLRYYGIIYCLLHSYYRIIGFFKYFINEAKN